MDYDNLVISIKSSDVTMCVRAHELIAERTRFPLADIARVNPDFIRPILHGRNRKPVIKMDIGHQRNMDLFFNLPECLSRLHGWNSGSDNVAARLLQLKNLTHGSGDVFRFRVCHRLHGDCPGNIGDAERVRAVVQTARERQIPIRVGVNSGSLERGAISG